MTKARKLIVGLLMVSLLAVGVVALAENGFGGKGSDDWAAARAAGECSCDDERDMDGDGISNCDDIRISVAPSTEAATVRCRATEEACVTAVATVCAMGVATATVSTDRSSI